MQAMQAIQGFYDNGTIRFNQKAPIKRGKFIMIFTEEERLPKSLMSKEESLHIFRKYSGSISREIDAEKERDEYLSEKYGPFDLHEYMVKTTIISEV
ncbi:MAG: hypothetical protein FWE86_03000 [Oscillospiraceae bacterium]|nr:hypothetical protein [Oscillospiraceae bacterium]